MSNKMECPNCGYDLNSSEKKCKYCGSLNQNFVQVNNRPATLPTYQQPQNNYPVRANNTVVKKKNDFSILLFLILLIIFWPAAIIYILVKAA